MREVILVCGPPCAGKSTYVRQHASPGDLVLDQDVIGVRAMRTALARLPAMVDGRAWVIRCAPGARRRAALARQLGATSVQLLTPAVDVLQARARNRPDPRRALAQVADWHHRETTNAPPRPPARQRGTTTGRGYGYDHQRRRTLALEALRQHPGQACGRCGAPMYPHQQLDYDHDDDRHGYRGLAHATCNRSAGGRKAARSRRRKPTSWTSSRAW